MTESVLQEGLPALPAQLQRFANDVVSWSKLKVARSITAPRQADAVERDIAAIHREWLGTNRDFAMRSANKLSRMVTRFRGDPRLGAFNNVNVGALGAIDAVDIASRQLAPAELTQIASALQAPSIVAVAPVTPEATNTVLRLRTNNLHCIEETDEWSSSDEIVWSATWVTPSGGTGYHWWRRTDFDKNETKSIADVFTFAVPQKFPNKFSFIFSMLEEDQSNAAKVVEGVWAKLKDKVKQKIDDFAAWLAGQIGWADLGPIIAAILNWVVNTVIGWLISIFAPDPMGTLPYTITLNGGTTWTSTHNAILPLTINHSGSGGRYTASLQFELA